VFFDISIARCRVKLKVEIQQRIAFGDLRVLAFDNERIDMPSGGVHDSVWRSPFALVLSALPKRQRTYRVLNVH
jgi:hypothetical protein